MTGRRRKTPTRASRRPVLKSVTRPASRPPPGMANRMHAGAQTRRPGFGRGSSRADRHQFGRGCVVSYGRYRGASPQPHRGTGACSTTSASGWSLRGAIRVPHSRYATSAERNSGSSTEHQSTRQAWARSKFRGQDHRVAGLLLRGGVEVGTSAVPLAQVEPRVSADSDPHGERRPRSFIASVMEYSTPG